MENGSSNFSKEVIPNGILYCLLEQQQQKVGMKHSNLDFSGAGKMGKWLVFYIEGYKFEKVKYH